MEYSITKTLEEYKKLLEGAEGVYEKFEMIYEIYKQSSIGGDIIKLDLIFNPEDPIVIFYLTENRAFKVKFSDADHIVYKGEYGERERERRRAKGYKEETK
jgi:hypothetical protein